MATGEHYIALDLGAESGRAIVGTLSDQRVQLDEVHRFANVGVRLGESLHWNVLQLWQEILAGLGRGAAACDREPAGVGIDSWALDFGLVDARGELLGIPHQYRDPRTAGVLDVLRAILSELELYRRTGIAYLPISTLGQLLALRRQSSPALAAADGLLLLPALFSYWLCGEQVCELTIAGNTQLLDLPSRTWSSEIFARCELPERILRPLVPTGSVLAPLTPSLADDLSLPSLPVIAPAWHDTASAIAAVPLQEQHAAFISSGTWSVIGAELSAPLLAPEALHHGFYNEVGAGGRILLARNSAGLWPLQECRRAWERQGHSWSYADLTAMAARAQPFAAIIDPDDSCFQQPGEMPARVAAYCQAHAQQPPADEASTVRSLLEGLALRYRATLEDLAALTGHAPQALHIVGGGARNALLCQLSADATGCVVVAGPSEATAAANVLLQAMARGRLASLEELREVVRRSFPLVSYEPHPSDAWEQAYAAFRCCG